MQAARAAGFGGMPLQGARQAGGRQEGRQAGGECRRGASRSLCSQHSARSRRQPPPAHRARPPEVQQVVQRLGQRVGLLHLCGVEWRGTPGNEVGWRAAPGQRLGLLHLRERWTGQSEAGAGGWVEGCVQGRRTGLLHLASAGMGVGWQAAGSAPQLRMARPACSRACLQQSAQHPATAALTWAQPGAACTPPLRSPRACGRAPPARPSAWAAPGRCKTLVILRGVERCRAGQGRAGQGGGLVTEARAHTKRTPCRQASNHCAGPGAASRCCQQALPATHPALPPHP